MRISNLWRFTGGILAGTFVTNALWVSSKIDRTFWFGCAFVVVFLWLAMEADWDA